jgi:tetratricopeptide (TPR) repeat protein
LRRAQKGEFPAPRQVDARIDRALEAICLKAMALKPEDRYGSSRLLADDIERWMADEPVTAWSEPISRRTRRWMQRNRTAVAAALVALGAGVVGLGAVAGVQARANNALLKANAATNAAFAETKQAKKATEAALAQSEENGRRAESNAQTARHEAQRADDNAGLINGALGGLVQRVGADPRLQTAGLTAFREELLRDVVGMYDELSRRNPREGTLGLGQALNNLALVRYLLGEFSQAIASQIRGEAVLAALPPNYETRLALANARKQLGVVYHFAGKPAEGLLKSQEAVLLYQALLRERPSDQFARFELARATAHLGNFAMGSDPNAAVARYREALTLIGALRSESPTNPRYADWEARTRSNLGLILQQTGKTEDAVAMQRRAVAVAEQVVDEFLRVDALANCRNNLAESLEQAKRPSEAETIFRLALKDYRTLADRFPDDVDHRWGVAMVLTNLAAVVLQQDRPKDALALIEESGKIFDNLKKALGANVDFQQQLEKHSRLRGAIQQKLDAKNP